MTFPLAFAAKRKPELLAAKYIARIQMPKGKLVDKLLEEGIRSLLKFKFFT